MGEDTLYERDRIKITYLHSPEPGKESEVISGEDHELWIKDESGEWNRYIIQRGILKDLANTVKNDDRHFSKLVNLLNTFNRFIYPALLEGEATLEELGRAFIGAYQKEEEDYERYLAERKKKKKIMKDILPKEETLN